MAAGPVRDSRQDDGVDVELGRRVQVERVARGLSQTELGERIGVTVQQVQRYESGARRISIWRLTQIGRIFGVDASYLLGAPRAAPIDPRERAEASEAMRMLGRSGAVRLLRAYVAIPPKLPALRESIVQMVEGITSAAAGEKQKQKQNKSKLTRRL